MKISHKKVPTVDILKTQTFDELAELVEFNNSITVHDKVLDGYQVEFDISATNSEGETKTFHIIYQNVERYDSMTAYNGYEMTEATQYGCDADESRKLEVFMNWDSGIFESMRSAANELAKEHFEYLSE